MNERRHTRDKSPAALILLFMFIGLLVLAVAL